MHEKLLPKKVEVSVQLHQRLLEVIDKDHVPALLAKHVWETPKAQLVPMVSEQTNRGSRLPETILEFILVTVGFSN